MSMFDESVLLGPTGEFPDGKIDKDDDGELNIGVGMKDGRIIIRFGYPVSWIGLTKDDARHLVDILEEKLKVMKGEG